MSENSVDPSGDTEAFRAFIDTPPEPAAASRSPLIAAGVAVALIVLALILWSVLR